MARAGYCEVCRTNVWLREDGSCANGHPPNCIVGVYEVGEPALATAEPAYFAPTSAYVLPADKPAGDVSTAILGTLGVMLAYFVLNFFIALLLVSLGIDTALIILIGLVEVGVIAILIYRDAESIGVSGSESAAFYGWWAFLLLIVFLPLYLYRRPILRWEAQYGEAAFPRCPHCGGANPVAFSVCQMCHRPLRGEPLDTYGF